MTSRKPTPAQEQITNQQEQIINQADILNQLHEMMGKIVDLHQTIRGYNGYPGMVADFERMQEKVENIEDKVGQLMSIGNKLTSIETTLQTINDRGCTYGQASGIHAPMSVQQSAPQPAVPQQSPNDPNTVKWDELRVQPVLAPGCCFTGCINFSSTNNVKIFHKINIERKKVCLIFKYL